VPTPVNVPAAAFSIDAPAGTDPVKFIKSKEFSAISCVVIS